MQDVARALGVHASTVSRALRNDRAIPPATRERIQERATAMGYRPNPLVSALIRLRRARRTTAFTTIAYIVRSGPTTPARERYEAGARAAAEKQGCRLEKFALGENGLRPKRLNDILRTRNIPGIIIGPLPEARGHFDLEWQHFSTVAIEYTFRRPQFDRVVHDSFGGMQLIVAECRRRGLRRVGLALSELAHERTDRKISAGYWADAEMHGFADAIPPLVVDAWDRALFRAWFDRFQPEAIVLANEFWGHVESWARQNGLRVGRDVHLLNVNAARGGSFSGVMQHSDFIGATAARMVIDKVFANDRGVPELPSITLVPGSWVEGKTLRAAPRSRRTAAALNGAGSSGARPASSSAAGAVPADYPAKIRAALGLR